MKMIFGLIGALFLAGCATAQPELMKTQVVPVIPPESLYRCPVPAHHKAATLTDKQVAKDLAAFVQARKQCAESLKSIKEYSDRTKAQLSQP